MDKFKEIIKKAEGVRLTKNEKAEMRAHLQAFVRGKTVLDEVAGRQVLAEKSLGFRFIKPMPILASLVLAAVLGGGVSFAAENSLPGDALYPVKLYLNEEVRAVLATSVEAKAGWEARRAERRLEEAEKLAADGRLEAGQQARIEKNFERHAEKTQASIAKLEAEADVRAAAELSSRLETSLEAHSRILDRLSVKSSLAKAVAVKAKARAEQAMKARLSAESKITGGAGKALEAAAAVSAGAAVDAVPVNADVAVDAQAEWKKEAAEGRMRSAGHKLIEVGEFIAKIKAAAGAEATAAAETKLALAGEALADGKAKLEAGLYGDAFLLFQKAHRIAQEAKLLLEARQALKVEFEFNGNTNAGTDAGENAGIKVETDTRIKIGL